MCVYLANEHHYCQGSQLEADLAAEVLPLSPNTSPYTLVCTIGLMDRDHTWRNAVLQVSAVARGNITVETMRNVVVLGEILGNLDIAAEHLGKIGGIWAL